MPFLTRALIRRRQRRQMRRLFRLLLERLTDGECASQDYRLGRQWAAEAASLAPAGIPGLRGAAHTSPLAIPRPFAYPGRCLCADRMDDEREPLSRGH
ncbi:MAG: hypothetical protein HUU25_14770 [Candidatus Sumerlaeia bacterium]|nr:hypothetical protein [Candidatus Sumerlaeia bacterium]